MFISFSRRLKSMSGIRFGVGLRLTKSNWWYFLFALMLYGCFYLCWYSVIACGWCLYFMLYAIYKLYYLIFKYGIIGVKKLYAYIKDVITRKSVT